MPKAHTPFSPPLVVERLRAGLAAPLPGLAAQRIMAPTPRLGWRPDEFPHDARNAAALLLLYPVGRTTHLALTLRTSHLPQHGGQVCLPGGAARPGESMEMTALREAAEEIGIDTNALTLLGQLTPLHIPVSGFMLFTVVAFASSRPSFRPHAGEVARVLDVPLGKLCEPAALHTRIWRHEGRDYEVPYFLVDGATVWGATAMVLSEFLSLLGHPPSPPTVTANGS